METWSQELRRLWWQQSGRLIEQDDRSDWSDTDWSNRVHFGFPSEFIRRSVIKRGLADFSRGYSHESYGELTDDELVTLYCFMNMKRHFFVSLATFRAHARLIDSLFDSGTKPLMFDIGCGPATAALALAEARGNQSKFEYLGVDSAPAMQERAEAIMQAASQRRIIASDVRFKFRKSWANLLPSYLSHSTHRRVLINFSYFFASHSLTAEDLDTLAEFVNGIRAAARTKRLVMVHTNSTDDRANQNLRAWLPRIRRVPKLQQATVKYQDTDSGTKSESFAYQVIDLK